jgi:phenylacetate-CoA ligase
VAEKLAQALEKLSRIWPSGFASPDEQIELTKMREIASYNAAQGEGFLLMPKDRSLSYTIAYSKDKSPESSPLNRSVYIKTVDSADEICSLIRPVSGYLQSVAIGGPLNRTTLIGEKLLKSGVCRVVPPGKMLEEKSGAPHDGRYNLCDLVKLVALEDRRDPFSQVAELFDFLSIKSSFWAERLEKFNPEEASSLSLVPYTKASEIVDNVPPLGNSLLTGPVSGSMVFASGGSTGKPKYIFYSYPEFDAVSKALAKCLMAAGLRKDDIAANGFVAGSLWTSFLAVHNALAYSGCFSLPIGGTSSVRQTVGYIVDFKATVVLGIPSYLTELARIIESDGLKDKLNVRLLLYAGERVTDSTAKYLCEAFGCKLIRSAGYASVDAGTIGYQCSYCEGSNHHILRDYQYVEFISPDTGEPVTEGECGEIVVTNLNRRLMPVVRMRSGDLGALSGIECPCGSPDPLFNLLGRADDRVFAGGARFMAGDFAKLAGTFEGLSSRVQIKLSSFNGLDHVAFLVESESPIPEEDKVLLSEKVIRAFIEAEEDYRFAFENDWIGKPSCTIVETGQIPRVERTGKIRLVADSRHGDGR